MWIFFFFNLKRSFKYNSEFICPASLPVEKLPSLQPMVLMGCQPWYCYTRRHEQWSRLTNKSTLSLRISVYELNRVKETLPWDGYTHDGKNKDRALNLPRANFSSSGQDLANRMKPVPREKQSWKTIASKPRVTMGGYSLSLGLPNYISQSILFYLTSSVSWVSVTSKDTWHKILHHHLATHSHPSKDSISSISFLRTKARATTCHMELGFPNLARTLFWPFSFCSRNTCLVVVSWCLRLLIKHHFTIFEHRAVSIPEM